MLHRVSSAWWRRGHVRPGLHGRRHGAPFRVSSSNSAMVAMMLVTARPGRGAGVHPFPQRPHVDAAIGQLVEGGGDFAYRTPEPVNSDDNEVVAFAEPAHAFCPAGPHAAGTPGGGVGEDSVGGYARRRDSVVLLVDGL